MKISLLFCAALCGFVITSAFSCPEKEFRTHGGKSTEKYVFRMYPCDSSEVLYNENLEMKRRQEKHINETHTAFLHDKQNFSKNIFKPVTQITEETSKFSAENDGCGYYFEAVQFNYRQALEIVVNCNLSLIACLIVILTAIFSSEWRQHPNNMVLVNLEFTLTIQEILYQLLYRIRLSQLMFKVLVIINHYIGLVMYTWISLVALMQYKRYVQVFEQIFTYYFACMSIAWISPLIVLSPVLTFRYVTENDFNCILLKETLCYVRLYSFLMITSINTSVFILIIRAIISSQSITKKNFSIEVKLFLVLYFSFDLNRSVLLICQMTDIHGWEFVFEWVESLQGVLLFIIFGLLRKHTRQLYIKFFRMSLHRSRIYRLHS